MGVMNSANIGSAIDFSTLGKPAAGGSWVMEVDEAGFDNLVRKSVQHPVVLEFYSPRDPAGQAVSDALTELSSAAGGKYLIGRVNVDTQPRIAQALQVQAVPTVVAVIGGQLAPLFQGTATKEDIAKALDQVVQAAAANGILGRAEPVDSAAGANDEQEAGVSDPRFIAADEALVAGDFAKAVEEFDKILAATPNDVEAIAGRAQAALLLRSTSLDATKVLAEAATHPKDVAAQFNAADLEVLNGAHAQGFDRLLSVGADLDADGREQVRVRLLELFEVVGRTDPIVLKARRRLSGLLF